MNTVSHNKGVKLPPEPLSKVEVLALMNACSRRAPTGIRDRALICVLWRSIIRISEALDLKPADFDAEACTLRVLHGKGDRHRVVAIDQGAVDVLLTWLECRKSLDGLNGHQPIFCTLKGNRMSDAQVREMLPRRAKKAGIEKRVHCHGLRHTGASELVDEKMDLRIISEQLGHASLATTERYIRALNPIARIEQIKGREW